MTSFDQTVCIHKLLISPGHDFKGRHGKGRLKHGIQSVDTARCVAGKGVEGDRFYGYKENFKGQITFIELEAVEAVMAELGLPEIAVEEMRRNVVVSGVDLNQLVGRRFEICGVEFAGTEECAPCYWMEGAVGEGAEKAMRGRGGLRCRIVRSGTLRLGEHGMRIW